MSSSSIAELSASIASNTAKYNDYLVSKGIPLPSHDTKPVSKEKAVALPEDIEAARKAALEASHELHELLAGPTGLIINAAPENTKLLSLQFIHRNKVANMFSWNQTITFKKIAERCQFDEEDTRRTLRLAMTYHLFKEPEVGVVAHTAASWTIAENPLLAAWIGVTTQENWPAVLRLVDAMQKWPGSEEPLESAYALAHNINENPFTVWERDPPRAKQFADAMSFLHSDDGFEPESLVEGFDFASVGKGLFVDVGGSHGQVSIELVRRYPELTCIVQDMPATVIEGRSRLPEDLKEQITFMAHDFWTEQPIKHADIYHFRWIFHDWSDSYSVKILRSLIPALKEGAKVLINDICIPPRGILPPYEEQWIRGIDLVMKSFTNAKERDGDDWASIFEKADQRFKFLGVKHPPKSKCAVIQAEWRP